MSGEQVGRYIIKDKLGRGGMATVYLAYDPQFERDVALKMLPVGPGYDHEFLERKFIQEAKIIASLEHFAIVPVYDFGNHDGRPFLVMRLMPEGTLKEQLFQGPLPLFEVKIVLDRICSALDKAHARNIVHRDVKPTNVFLDEDGLAYLGDFGIARVTAGDQTTSRIGSPRYMAPEMVSGNPLTPQTDIYQIGIVLYEMLTGELPFIGDTTEHTMMLHLQGEIPRPSATNPEVPLAIDNVLLKALAKDPGDRFSTAGEMAKAYKDALEYGISPVLDENTTDWGGLTMPDAFSDPTQARNRPPTGQMAAYSPPAQVQQSTVPNRNVWLVGLFVVAMLMLACGLTVFVLGITDRLPTQIFNEPEPIILIPTIDEQIVEGQGADTTQPTQPATGEIGGEGEGEEPELELAPTVTLEEDREDLDDLESVVNLQPSEMASRGAGTGRIVYASDRDGDFDLYVTNEAGSTSPLFNTPRDEYSPAVSPDGTRIAYHTIEPVNGTWEIFLIGIGGGEPVNLTNESADDSFPRWSPDGSRIVFHSNRRAVDGEPIFDVYTIDINSRAVAQLTASPDGDLGPSWSPDGERIVFHRRFGLGRQELFMINADGSGETQLTTLSAVSQFPAWSPDGSKIAFHSNANGVYDIFVLDMTTGELSTITNSQNNTFFPDWTPNGEWIIYHGELADENRELFMSNVATSEVIRLTDSVDEERMPSWQP
ncbi:MAG: protein kinase [Chloroflexota bacterium]